MAYKLRVQEYNKISGKTHLSHNGYPDIRKAFIAMRSRAHLCRQSFAKYDAATDKVVNTAVIETDRDTNIVVKCGRAVRIFTLVLGRNSTPVPFGHLLKQEATTTP